MNDARDSKRSQSAAAVEDLMEQMRRAAADAALEMGVYAEKHNVDLTGTTIKLTHDDVPRLTVTIPKYIEQDHREQLERLAKSAVAHNPISPEVNFVYEQSAG